VTADACAPDLDAAYLCTRVIDALLRENVRDCLSRGRLVDTSALPAGAAAGFAAGQQWLQLDHLGVTPLWIAVTRETFMQPWRLTGLPLIAGEPGGWRALQCLDDVLAAFRAGLPAEAARGFDDFAQECSVALEHRRACEAERRRWFAAAGPLPADASERLLHYDRLGAFLDHPFYPTARAKLGFTTEELRAYSPEFAPRFALQWLAVPRELYAPSGERLPPGWPELEDLGLPAGLRHSHALLPVHPFLWGVRLRVQLREVGLEEAVIPAPRRALAVTPTLSVRTLALVEAPQWHLKLPLPIRTLGARNIRTIKPSTIHDGHRVQTLLGAVLAREPALRQRVLLTEEDSGAHVAGHSFLGFILRRYPDAALRGCATPVPVAALGARSPQGGSVFEELAQRHYGGDALALFDDYLDLTLRLHLTLWLRYGIALESNQQNTLLVLDAATPRLRLLLKDNDAARIERAVLERRWPALVPQVASLQDGRIVAADALALAQMFTTITLQLNIAVLAEQLARLRSEPATRLYARVRARLMQLLDELAGQGEDTALACRLLLEDEQLYLKYLLVAATLLDKGTTGAADVNKYYGRTAPNFLRSAP